MVQVVSPHGTLIYQIVNAAVDSQGLDARNKADVIIGDAVQLGRWDATKGAFEHYGWVPPPRSPVTRLSTVDPPAPDPDEVPLGVIPSTQLPILLRKEIAVSHHTAILGVTGVGKSFFTRHLVRQLASPDLRVIVIDFTREWKDKLAKEPTPLLLDDAASAPLRTAIDQLGQQLAEFKNKQDTAKIAALRKSLMDGFKAAIQDHTQSNDYVRVFELPDVSNTEGVLEYTHWFFKSLFELARDRQLNNKRLCIVLEEAHTVVPEWNFIGLADKSSQSIVNNISQIALQGRKYGVGFLVIAQRTASVSKTVLTQCNTIIAFQCFDATSLEFLGNYLPVPFVEAIPRLGMRRAVAVGKAIRGSLPMIFEVPDLRGEEPGQ